MNRHGTGFLLAAVAAAVLLCPWVGEWIPAFDPFWPASYPPVGPTLVGIGVILIHWWTGPSKQTSELADSSYFLGFLLTLLFLVFALVDVGGGGMTETWVTRLTRDLGVGLSFTIVGLTIRQVRTLAIRSSVEPIAGRAADLEPIAAVQQLTQQLTGRVGTSIPPSQTQVADPFGHAANEFESAVIDASKRLRASLEKLADDSAKAAVEITGASSKLRTDLHNDLAGLAQEVQKTVNVVRDSRQGLVQLLDDTAGEMQRTQDTVGRLARAQAAEWEEAVRDMHGHLIGVRAAIEEESRGGLTALSDSSKALVELADAIVDKTRELPNPSVRLQALWTELADQQARVVRALEATSGALEQFGGMAIGAKAGLGDLDAGARECVRTLTESSGKVRGALIGEVTSLRQLVDELYEVVEGRINAIGRR